MFTLIKNNRKYVPQFKRNSNLTHIILTCKDFDKRTFEELYRDSLRRGEFDVPFHYFIDSDGTVHEGRKDTEIASSRLYDYKTALHIFIDSPTTTLTDEQQVALDELLSMYSGLIVT